MTGEMESQYHSLQRLSSDEETFADSESMTVSSRKSKPKRRSWRRSRDLHNPAWRGRPRTFALLVTSNVILLVITIAFSLHIKYDHCSSQQPVAAPELLGDVNGIVPKCKNRRLGEERNANSILAVALERTVFREDERYANVRMFEDHSEFRTILKRWRKDMPGKIHWNKTRS